MKRFSFVQQLLLLQLLLDVASATRHAVDIILGPYEDYHVEAEKIQSHGRIDFRRLQFSVVDGNANSGNYNNNSNNADDDDGYATTYDQGESVLIETVVVGCGDLDKTTCLQQYNGIGKQINGNLYICCTEAALAAGVCNEQGRLILNEDFDGKQLSVQLSPGQSGYLDDTTIRAVGTGSNTVLFVNCNEEYSISVTGSLGFRSSYGFLTQVSWRFSWVSHLMTLISGGALMWFVRHCRGKKPFEMAMKVILLLAFLESFIYSWYFIVFNLSGVEPVAIATIRELLRAFKYGLGHTFILLVAFGWEQHETHADIIPMYTICSLGLLYTLILVIPSFQHPSIVGQVFGLLFMKWAITATTRMIDRFKLDKDMMNKFTLLRGVFAFSLIVYVAMFITYCIEWSKSHNDDDFETLHRRMYAIRQFVFLCMILSIGIILQPTSEPLLKEFDDPVVTVVVSEDKENSKENPEIA